MADPKVIMIGLDLSLASEELIGLLIEDPPDQSIFNEIAKANEKRSEILKLLIEHPNTPDDVRQFISGILQLPVKTQKELVKAEKPQEERTHGILQKIQKLTVTEKIHLAMRGGREIRSILIKDPNKQIMLTVLDNTKITDSEIELLCQSRHTLEDALRKISKNREWMKSYSIVLAMISNPKTPPGISLPFVSKIRVYDLARLERNKNIPEIIRNAAKKVIKARKPQ